MTEANPQPIPFLDHCPPDPLQKRKNIQTMFLHTPWSLLLAWSGQQTYGSGQPELSKDLNLRHDTTSWPGVDRWKERMGGDIVPLHMNHQGKQQREGLGYEVEGKGQPPMFRGPSQTAP